MLLELESDELASVIADAIKAATGPLVARIAVLEQRQAVAGPEGPEGKPGAPGEPGQPGRDGKDAEVDYEAVVASVLKAIPVPKDGRDGTDGINGKDAEPVDLDAVVKAASALIPVPKDGRDGKDGKDGIGVAGAMIGKDGHLVLTCSDGSVQPLGIVVGKDGAVGERGERGIDGLNGKDGAPGRDGTLDGLKAVFDGERTVTFSCKDGTPIDGGIVKFVGLSIYRGVFDHARAYETGDQVTWGGSQWTAKCDSIGQKPDTQAGAKYWLLSVKRGNEGKVGPVGAKGDIGPRGEPGPIRERY